MEIVESPPEPEFRDFPFEARATLDVHHRDQVSVPLEGDRISGDITVIDLQGILFRQAIQDDRGPLTEATLWLAPKSDLDGSASWSAPV